MARFVYLHISPYSARKRRLILAGLIIGPFLIALVFGGFAYWINRPTNITTVLVADFDGPEPKNYRVAETVIEQLREATRNYPETGIQSLGRPITAQEENEIARRSGEEHKASIVLWGWCGKTGENVRLTVHFELLRKPQRLKVERENQTLNLPVAMLETFKLQEQLSGEMAYLMLVAIGLARYEAGDYTEALSQPALPERVLNPGVIYFAVKPVPLQVLGEQIALSLQSKSVVVLEIKRHG